MKFAKLLAIVMALVLCLGCLAACGGKKDSESAGTIKIGLSGPLTGGAAVYGLAVKNAAQMAIDEINKEIEETGSLDVKFELIALDDVNDVTKIESNYLELYEKGMQISLGTVTTKPGLEFMEYAHEDNVFFITPSASGDNIPKYDNGFQMCFADSNQGTAAANYVNDNFADKKIGVLYKSDDDYSAGIYNKFIDSLNAGIKETLVTESFLGETDSYDFAAQINNLKDCDLIFMPIYYGPAAQFMKQAKGLVADDAIYYGCDGFDGLEGQFENFAEEVPQKVSMLSHFNSKAEEGKAAEFIKKYKDTYDEKTLNQFGASAYDCIYAIYEALKAAKAAGVEFDASTEPAEFCDILKKQFTEGFKFSGVTGEDISWDANGYVTKDAIRYDLK